MFTTSSQDASSVEHLGKPQDPSLTAICKTTATPVVLGSEGNEDIEEAVKTFADFQPQLLLTPEAVGADFVDSTAPVHRFLMQWHSPINPSV